MTEEKILNHHCSKIEQIIDSYMAHNDIEELRINIRAEMQEAMSKARNEALRGN